MFFENRELYQTAMEENFRILKQVLKQTDRVIVAWGTDTINYKNIYDQTIQKILQVLEGRDVHFVQSKSKDGYPRHAQIWSVNQKIHEYKYV